MYQPCGFELCCCHQDEIFGMPLALMGQASVLTASIYPEGKLFSRMNKCVSCAVELSQATFSKTVFLLAKQSPFLLEQC